MKIGDYVFVNEKSFGRIGQYKDSIGIVTRLDQDGDPIICIAHEYLFALKREVTIIPEGLKDEPPETIRLYFAL